MVDLMQVTEGELRASIARTDEALILKLAGTADHESNAALDQLVARVRLEAKQSRPREVTVDMLDLDFMNSSSLKVLVTWIADLLDGTEESYQVRFVSSSAHHWQKRSLLALKQFAVDRVIIETR